MTPNYLLAWLDERDDPEDGWSDRYSDLVAVVQKWRLLP